MILAEAYTILELGPSCTLADVRKAYRLKAKVLHPDVNKAPGAHGQFVQLREAYEYLVDIKSGKLTNSSSNTTKEPEAHAWTEERKEEARERARQYADMRYREFRKSSHDKYYAFEVGVDFGQFIFSLLVGIALTIALSMNMGMPGLVIGLLAIFKAWFFKFPGGISRFCHPVSNRKLLGYAVMPNKGLIDIQQQVQVLALHAEFPGKRFVH